MRKLTLYHGSNVLFNEMDLSYSRNNRDFGRGFYTTTIREQAEIWAKALSLRYGGVAYIYTFEFSWVEDLSSKVFDDLNGEWLEMVKSNRTQGGIQHSFDIVKGPVANDDTMPTIALYVDGLLNEEAALAQLAYSEANDQISFHTNKALGYLLMLSRKPL